MAFLTRFHNTGLETIALHEVYRTQALALWPCPGGFLCSVIIGEATWPTIFLLASAEGQEGY